MFTAIRKCSHPIDSSTRAFDAWALTTGNPTLANDLWGKLYEKVLAEVKTIKPVELGVSRTRLRSLLSAITIDGVTYTVDSDRMHDAQRDIAGDVVHRRMVLSGSSQHPRLYLCAQP